MFYINNPGTTFINSMFLQTTIFLLLGVVVFWLISYKLMSNYVFPLNVNIEENIIEEINIKE